MEHRQTNRTFGGRSQRSSIHCAWVCFLSLLLALVWLIFCAYTKAIKKYSDARRFLQDCYSIHFFLLLYSLASYFLLSSRFLHLPFLSHSLSFFLFFFISFLCPFAF